MINLYCPRKFGILPTQLLFILRMKLLNDVLDLICSQESLIEILQSLIHGCMDAPEAFIPRSYYKKFQNAVTSCLCLGAYPIPGNIVHAIFLWMCPRHLFRGAVPTNSRIQLLLFAPWGVFNPFWRCICVTNAPYMPCSTKQMSFLDVYSATNDRNKTLIGP